MKRPSAVLSRIVTSYNKQKDYALEVRTPKIPISEVIHLLLCINRKEDKPKLEDHPFELPCKSFADIFLELTLRNLCNFLDWRCMSLISIEF
jgi:hypothetical protein